MHTQDQLQAGCYGDGANGHQYCRQVLAVMLRSYEDDPAAAACADDIPMLALSLQGPMPDDAWDEYNAIDLLEGIGAIPDGLVLDFVDGDLVCCQASEA